MASPISLAPDDQADNSHNDRVVLAHLVAQAGQDPLRPVAESEEHHDRGRNAHGRDEGEDDIGDDISISATAMIGTGLSATPTARGRICPIAAPIWLPGLVSHHAAEAEMTG